MLRNFFTFSRFTLFVALCISAIAAWYSVIGLTAIFAGAVIPIIIMGGILEVAKITTTVWLHRYWDRAGYAVRTYLTVAVVALACLTSMGIFGLLSKAHLEQGVVGGEVQSKVALLDEKIKTQRDNIDVARKALAQMDAQVDQRLQRGDSESGAERAVQIRRQQAPERSRLLKEIADAQREISRLNEERAPIASQLRKVEAEVGPIKYIAALVYGDNPDVTTLERAVRWVIILIVVVFDPLAIVLILAANNSLKWEREKADKAELNQPASPVHNEDEAVDTPPITGETEEWKVKIAEVENSTPWPIMPDAVEEPQVEAADINQEVEAQPQPTYVQGNYKTNYSIKPLPEKIIALGSTTESTKESAQEVDESSSNPVDEPVLETLESDKQDIVTEGVTTEAQIYSSDSDYVQFDGKKMSLQALKNLRPDLIVTGPIENQILFGNKFPPVSRSGDIYTRVDVVPHKTYKFNGAKWIEVNRVENTSYLQNIAYIQYLISQIDSGIYDPELLNAAEQDEISDYLKRTT